MLRSHTVGQADDTGALSLTGSCYVFGIVFVPYYFLANGSYQGYAYMRSPVAAFSADV